VTRALAEEFENNNVAFIASVLLTKEILLISLLVNDPSL
jgi:hypothetical protein